jgi:hypothetical protein
VAKDAEKSHRVPNTSDILILGELMQDPAPRESPQAEMTAEDIIDSSLRSVEVL